MISQGIRTSTANKPHILVLFQGGGGPDHCPPLDPRMNYSFRFNVDVIQKVQRHDDLIKAHAMR